MAPHLLRHLFGRQKAKNPLAFVFYSTSERYAAAALVFVHLLRGLGIRGDADVLLLHFPLPPAMLDKARKMGIITRPMAAFRGGPGHHYRHCYVKLRALCSSRVRADPVCRCRRDSSEEPRSDSFARDEKSDRRPFWPTGCRNRTGPAPCSWRGHPAPSGDACAPTSPAPAVPVSTTWIF